MPQKPTHWTELWDFHGYTTELPSSVQIQNYKKSNGGRFIIVALTLTVCDSQVFLVGTTQRGQGHRQYVKRLPGVSDWSGYNTNE